MPITGFLHRTSMPPAVGWRSPSRRDRVAAPAAPWIGAAARRPPAPNAEIVRLHYAIEALRLEGRPAVLQFIAAGRGEGCSLIARLYARAAACDSPVLLVRCDAGEEVGRDLSLLQDGGSLDDLLLPDAEYGNLAHAVLDCSGAGAAGARAGIGAAAMRQVFERLTERFRTVVLDCPPVVDAPASLVLARCCDGTVLVTAAGQTRLSALSSTRQQIERGGGQIVGAVVNRQPPLPGWLARRL